MHRSEVEFRRMASKFYNLKETNLTGEARPGWVYEGDRGDITSNHIKECEIAAIVLAEGSKRCCRK